MSANDLGNGIYALADGRVRSYLVLGTERGLVIDTGVGDTDVLANAREITQLPLTLVNTHYHGDHTAKNSDFDAVYAHPNDFDRLRDNSPELFPVTEGYKFELGGRTVEVFETPGHTPGAIALIDDLARVIFTGDSIAADVPVYMQMPDSDMAKLAESLQKIIGLSDRYDNIYPCHGIYPLTPDYAQKMLDCANAVLDGTSEDEIADFRNDSKVRIAHFAGVSFYRPV